MSFIETLYQELEEQLRGAADGAANALQKAERSIRVTRSVMRQLKEYVLQEGFSNEAEEIHFFKEWNPRFLKHLLFSTNLFSFEEKRPVGTKDEQIGYFHQAITRIRLYFARHEELYTYYRLGRTEEDARRFLRSSTSEEESPELDQRFCTASSYHLGKILASEAFLVHLTGELHILEHGPSVLPIQAKEPSPLVWTDSKVSFIELVYAIQSSGSVNNGKISVAQLMAILAEALQVDPGNYYAVFQQNIRIRKKRRTVYLDFLTEKLEERMDESDENPRYK